VATAAAIERRGIVENKGLQSTISLSRLRTDLVLFVMALLSVAFTRCHVCLPRVSGYLLYYCVETTRHNLISLGIYAMNRTAYSDQSSSTIDSVFIASRLLAAFNCQ
jgi:hypothetical protein